MKWGNLFGFDPAATITAARLMLPIGSANGAATTQDYPIYRVTKQWTESTTTWVAASPSSNWQVPGAQGLLDRGPQVGTLQATPWTEYVIPLNADGVAMVQSWLTHPSRGIIIASPTNDDDVVLTSSESDTRGPRLEVTYTTTSSCDEAVGGAPSE